MASFSVSSVHGSSMCPIHQMSTLSISTQGQKSKVSRSGQMKTHLLARRNVGWKPPAATQKQPKRKVNTNVPVIIDNNLKSLKPTEKKPVMLEKSGRYSTNDPVINTPALYDGAQKNEQSSRVATVINLKGRRHTRPQPVYPLDLPESRRSESRSDYSRLSTPCDVRSYRSNNSDVSNISCNDILNNGSKDKSIANKDMIKSFNKMNIKLSAMYKKSPSQKHAHRRNIQSRRNYNRERNNQFERQKILLNSATILDQGDYDVHKHIVETKQMEGTDYTMNRILPQDEVQAKRHGKINWRQAPKIAVNETKTSMLRGKYTSVCGKKRRPPPPSISFTLYK